MDKQKIFSREDKEIYRDGDKLIKVFDSEYSKANILNEALNHARVEETNLNMPKIRSIRVVDGKWAIILDYIEGKTLQSLMDEHPEKEDEYLNLFVDLQMEVLSKKVPLLNKLKDKMQSQISATDLDATTRYELHTRLDSMPKHTHLCHGDFNPSNVIVGDDGELYACDWAHATQGSAAADAAISYMLFEMEDHELAQKYLDLYCKKSDTPRQVVHNWLSIVAAAELSRGREKDYDFMMSWIDVVDYQ